MSMLSYIAVTWAGYWPAKAVPFQVVRSMPTPFSSVRVHWPQGLPSCDKGSGP